MSATEAPSTGSPSASVTTYCIVKVSSMYWVVTLKTCESPRVA